MKMVIDEQPCRFSRLRQLDRHVTRKISKEPADPRRRRSKGGTHVPRHRVLRPSLRRSDRTPLAYAEARRRKPTSRLTFRARKSGNEEVPGWEGGGRRGRSLEKNRHHLPLAPGRSLMMQLNSNRRIDSSGIMILSWSETKRGRQSLPRLGARDRITGTQWPRCRANGSSPRVASRHPVYRVWTESLESEPGRIARDCQSARKKWCFLERRITRDDVNCVCDTNDQIQSSGWRILVDIRFADAIPTTRNTRLEGSSRLEWCRKVGGLPVRFLRTELIQYHRYVR